MKHEVREAYIAGYDAKSIYFNADFAKMTGSITAGLMLTQAVFWSGTDTVRKRDGWFYKTQAQWEEDTGMSRREQETARKRLKQMGLMEEDRRGVPATMWFRVNRDELANQIVRFRQSSMAESANLDCTKAPILNGGKRQSITEYTAETTTEETPEYMAQAPKRRNEPLNDHWVPSDSTLVWAAREGFTRDQVEAQRPRFVDHHLSTGKPKKDWDRAFQLWMRNARDWGHLNGKATGPGKEDQSARLMREALEMREQELRR